MSPIQLKAEFKRLGVTDRLRVRMINGTLHVYLSKAVRQNEPLLSAIVGTIELETGRKDFSVPGNFARYMIVPTHEG